MAFAAPLVENILNPTFRLETREFRTKKAAGLKPAASGGAKKRSPPQRADISTVYYSQERYGRQADKHCQSLPNTAKR